MRPFPSDSLTRFAHRASCFHRPFALIPLPFTRWISQKLTGTIHNNIEAAVLGKAVQAGTRMRMSSLQQTGKDKVREVGGMKKRQGHIQPASLWAQCLC